MESLALHPVYIKKFKSAQIVSAESKEIIEVLKRRRAEELAEKRANIEARRQQVTKFANELPTTSNSNIKNNLIDDIQSKNSEQDKQLVNSTDVINTLDNTETIVLPLILPSSSTEGEASKYNGDKLEGDQFQVETNNDWEDVKSTTSLESNYKYSIQKKNKSSRWFDFKKKIFDKASLVYLESKNAKELIQKRKTEELAEKCAKVHKRRQKPILAEEKQLHKRLLERKSLNLIEKEKQTQNLHEDVFLEDTTKSVSKNVVEDNFNSLPEECEDINNENEEVDETSDENTSNDSAYTSEYDTDYDSGFDDEFHQHFNANNDIIKEKLQTVNIINYKENIKKINKEINEAVIVIKACQNLSNNLNVIPMETRTKRNYIQRQRQNRRLSVEELRRQRCEKAEHVRVDSRLAASAVHDARVNESWRRRRLVASTRENKKHTSSKINIKSSRWAQERALVEQEVAIRLQEEIKNLQDLLN